MTQAFVAATAAGLSADIVKLVIARTRPRAFDFDAHSLAEGFTKIFPLWSGGSAMQSFPSAHTASAFGFAALMTSLYPQGGPAFVTLATLTGMQRIGAGAHFPSDVSVGAALGWLVGVAFLRWSPLASRWERWDHHWKSGIRAPFARADHTETGACPESEMQTNQAA
jgi:membrane-associated phospholipid phosphatase